ncbi:MAG: helix-turn-helix domain-containing protein [Bdellovibrionaceae bacterium]|nr:helix-turn-helix domain-containing protein [Pseudobdellovibrionaceae bacterium]MCB9092907.1 helix-turn-helix domain-containing protein [Halobacteriovoraceae bacterium]
MKKKKTKIQRKRSENKQYQKFLKLGQRQVKFRLAEFIVLEQKREPNIISQTKIARELDVPTSSIGRIIKDKEQANPTWHTLLAIQAVCSKLLGRKVKISEFYSEK